LIEEYGETNVINPEFAFFLLEKILNDWVDMDEEYYSIVANWILGTYFIDEFVSYPYLFINAVKRSGKTRLLKLVAQLSFNGIYTAELTEAVLFRLPSVKQCTFSIDEAENISAKEKAGLRLLLNSAYKKGMKIYRARKVPKSEKYVIDEFEIFMPIAIANIYGMDDVLEDRCVSIILERSTKVNIVNKPEYFELDLKFNFFKYVIERIVSVGSVCLLVKNQYNNFKLLNSTLHSVVDSYQPTSDTTNTTNTTNTTDTTDIISDLEKIIRGMIEKKIVGRDFECWYPIFIINLAFNSNGYENLLENVSKLVTEKRTSDIMEDRDTSIMIFLGSLIIDKTDDQFFTLSKIVRQYSDQENSNWLTTEKLSKILKRLKVVIEKKRMSTGREVRLDFSKIKERLKQMNIVSEPLVEKQQTFNDYPKETEG
jgi:hypothetical protein